MQGYTGIMLELNRSTPMSYYHTPRKRQKTESFPTFSGGIEMGHWREKG